MVDSQEIKKILFVIGLFFLIGYIIYGFYQHSTELERDGFKVVEEHESYMLVEKDGHQYIATETGMYHLSWTFEHYPQCPCKLKKPETPSDKDIIEIEE